MTHRVVIPVSANSLRNGDVLTEKALREIVETAVGTPVSVGGAVVGTVVQAIFDEPGQMAVLHVDLEGVQAKELGIKDASDLRMDIWPQC